MSVHLGNLLLLSMLAGGGELAVEGDIIAGQSVNLQLSGLASLDQVPLVANYRVNAHKRLQRQQTIGVTDAAGRLRWVPIEPGVVVLSWPDGSKKVSVLHDGVPVSGVIIAVLAGLLLIGGTGFFFVRMLREGGG